MTITDTTDERWTMTKPAEPDVRARWLHVERPVFVTLEQREELYFDVEWHVEADGYEGDVRVANIQTNGQTLEDDVESITTQIDNADEHVHAVGAERVDVADVGVVHFFCVHESQLPDGISADELTFDEHENAVETVDGFDYDGDDDATRFQVDVYPVLETQCTTHD